MKQRRHVITISNILITYWHVRTSKLKIKLKLSLNRSWKKIEVDRVWWDRDLKKLPLKLKFKLKVIFKRYLKVTEFGNKKVFFCLNLKKSLENINWHTEKLTPQSRVKRASFF